MRWRACGRSLNTTTSADEKPHNFACTYSLLYNTTAKCLYSHEHGNVNTTAHMHVTVNMGNYSCKPSIHAVVDIWI